MKLIAKLQLLLFVSTMLIFTFFSYVSYHYDEIRFLDQTKQNLTAIANIQKNRLKQFLETSDEKIKLLTSKTRLNVSVKKYLDTKNKKHFNFINEILYDAQKSQTKNLEISLTDLGGTIIASTDPKAINSHLNNFPTSKELLQEVTIETYLDIRDILHYRSRAPLHQNEKIIGTLIVDSEMSDLDLITKDYTGLGKTGETVIAKATPSGAVFLTSLRMDKEKTIKTISGTKQNVPIIKALNNEIGFFSDTIDYRGVEVYSATQYIQSVYWGIVVKVDKSEIDEKLTMYRDELLNMLIFIFPFILLVSFLIARSFAKPIIDLTEVVKSFGNEDYSQKADESSKDELGILAKNFNTMTVEMNRTQRRLKEAQSLAHMGSWEFDLENKKLYWSQNVFNIFEIAQHERDAENTYAIFLDHIHPNDKDLVKNSYINSIKNNKKYQIEHRIITPSGKIKFVEEIAIHNINETGKILKSYGALVDITDNKEKNFKLQEQIRLIDQYIIMSTTDIHGNITYASKAFCQISGYSLEELLGQNHRIVRHPDMSNDLYKNLWQTLMKKQTWQGEIKNRKKDGGYYWVYATISPVYDIHKNIIGYTAIREDIADKKNTQEAQRIAKMGSWEYDIVKDEIQCSEEMCHLFEIPIQSRYPKQFIMEFIEGKYQEKVLGKLERSIIDNEKFEVEFVIKTAQKKKKTLYALGEIERDKNEKALKLIGISLDITERKKIEKQLHAAKIQAEQAAVAKGDFVANMSHEIRTPMNAILGFTDLALKSDNLEDKVYDYLRKSKSAASGLLDIINAILDFSKIESKKLIIEEITFNLKALMVEIMEIMEFPANKKKLELHLEFSDLGDCYIGDPIRIKQILVNIIGNAVKFTKKGSVKVVVSKNSGVIQFKVTDTGIGMSQQQIARIFEPFVQADTSTARKFGGTGLGTVIS